MKRRFQFLGASAASLLAFSAFAQDVSQPNADPVNSGESSIPQSRFPDRLNNAAPPEPDSARDGVSNTRIPDRLNNADRNVTDNALGGIPEVQDGNVSNSAAGLAGMSFGTNAVSDAGRPGDRQADVEIAGRIRREIAAGQSMSANARSVTIGRLNGRMTLSGRVDSEAEKRLIGEIANRHSAAERVDNQLEVVRATSSSK